MGAIQSIRKKGSLLMGTIGAALLLFVLGQGIKGIIPLLSKKGLYVGEIAGEKIQYYQYNELLNKFKTEYTRKDDKSINDTNINNTLWGHYIKEYVEKHMLTQEYKKLGLIVSSEEMVDSVQGKYIHNYIRQLFVDENGNFNKSKVLEFLELMPNRSKDEQMRWHYIEDRLKKDILYQKLSTMLCDAIYITDTQLENKRIYEYAELDLESIFIPYESISSENIKVQDNELQEYILQNKEKYKVKKSIDILYAEWPILPLEDDIKTFDMELEDLVKNFKNTSDSVEFAKKFTEGSENEVEQIYSYKDLRKLFPKIRNFKKGLVIGPQKQEDDIYKIYKVYKIKKSKKSLEYYAAVIEKKLIPSDKTKNLLYRQAEQVSNNIKNKKQLEEAKDRSSFSVHTAKQITEKTETLNELENIREIIKWLFKKQNKNKTSPVFEINGKFIVCIPIKYNKAGLVELEYVKDEVKEEVIKQKKYQIVKDNIQLSKEKTLHDIAQEYGKQAKVIKLKDVKFKDNILKEVGEVKKAIGKAFSLKIPGDRTNIFSENNGVLVLELLEKREPPSENHRKQKEALNMSERVIERLNVYFALEDKAKIKDYRYKFY